MVESGDNLKRTMQLNPSLKNGLKRLKGITGFVSIIGNDTRVEIFNRYNHVCRVVTVAEYLVSRQKQIDTDECILIALLHDVNRLPFAHLLEKRIGFRQEEYFDLFFDLFGLNPGIKVIEDLKDITQKKTDGSREATLVFLADCVCGFIEDSLFAFSLFGVDPMKIPMDITDQLGYIKLPYIGREMKILKHKFEINKGFTNYFNRLVLKFAVNFIDYHNLSDIDKTDFSGFNIVRQNIRSGLLLKEIFPINNELVSKGSYLFKNFMLPYIDLLKSQKTDPIMKLLMMTDMEMLNDAEQVGVLKCRKEDLYPDLKGF